MYMCVCRYLPLSPLHRAVRSIPVRRNIYTTHSHIHYHSHDTAKLSQHDYCTLWYDSDSLHQHDAVHDVCAVLMCDVCCAVCAVRHVRGGSVLIAHAPNGSTTRCLCCDEVVSTHNSNNNKAHQAQSTHKAHTKHTKHTHKKTKHNVRQSM